jgi:uroporphyrinogen-III synthase
MPESGALKGLSVLVTRPAQQAEPFCELLASHQANIYRFPVMQVVPAPDQQAIVARMRSVLPVSKIIFISANAVMHGIPLLEVADKGFATDAQLVAIGSATTKSLEQMGYVPRITPREPFNSEALLSLPQMEHVAGESILLVKGQGGRGMLNNKLRERGAIVHEVELYSREKANPDPAVFNDFMTAANPVVAITSVTGLEYLFDLLDEEQAHWARNEARFLVPGDRVADELHTFRVHTKPLIALNATDEVMLQTLIGDQA